MIPLYLLDTGPLSTTCLSQGAILGQLGFDVVRAGLRAGNRWERLVPGIRLPLEDSLTSSAKSRQPRLQRQAAPRRS